MKKYLVHIIYLLVIAFFVVYANIKANEAEKMAMVATEQTELANEAQEQAQRMAEIAEEEAARSKITEMRAIEAANALEECKAQKK